MKIRLIGLGKMGRSIALNLKDHNHEVLGYDIKESARDKFAELKLDVVHDLPSLLKRDEKERAVVLLFVPNEAVDSVLEKLIPILNKDDIVIDGGNSNFNISIKRYHLLKGKGIDFVDLGTSGGISGARYGVCLMAGGSKEVVTYLEPMFKDISQENGYAYVGKPGAGHFVKMVHIGIEYGMMQAISEGFSLLEASPFELDYEEISRAWSNGSLIESALIKHAHNAFAKDSHLNDLEGKIDDTGEGMWMIEEALKYKVSLPVITQSLYARYKSKDNRLFGEKVVAAMRKEFGGHAVYRKK
ncbi:phosphogluconate dehydrogenase (NAD(+)-dependent, decarboxylating) [Peloplasma aerotolerans]|uniref:Decarboxylating 6-phosphogluconate dehydrogenase n=1 Tax=Peloplasma aerotolerans TaxID=3044389 RepID=A0AAW6U4Z3_9MOLU|nr:decarboxylating 6-phosphogluconate dehydrogenase [Mariniplasma sp. M4Ah]MDI6452987.1 decarboxylating 6-phosphogluconate dehydrogenase [Mariniplasma sp. M4Ah]